MRSTDMGDIWEVVVLVCPWREKKMIKKREQECWSWGWSEVKAKRLQCKITFLRIFEYMPCNAENMGFMCPTPGQGTKIPHAMEQLSPCTITREPGCWNEKILRATTRTWPSLIKTNKSKRVIVSWIYKSSSSLTFSISSS